MNKLINKLSLILIITGFTLGASAAAEPAPASSAGMYFSDWAPDVNTGLNSGENFNLRKEAASARVVSFSAHEGTVEDDNVGYERPSIFSNNLFLIAIIGGIAAAASGGGGGSSKKGVGYDEKLIFNNPEDPTEIEIRVSLDSLYDKSITVSTQAGNYYFCKLAAQKCAVNEKVNGDVTAQATVGVFLGKRPAVYKDNISAFIATVSLSPPASAELTSDYDLPLAISLKFTQNTLNYQENYQLSELIPPGS